MWSQEDEIEARFTEPMTEALGRDAYEDARAAGAVHAAVEGWAGGGELGFFARSPACRSVSVTTITVPPGTDVDALREVARERFQVAMAGALGNAARPQNTGSSATQTVACPKCGASSPVAAKFCNECGAKMEVAAATVPCINCGAQLHQGAKFCSECGSSQEKPKCSNCKAELSPGAKFCNECGTKIG